jgi:hypothetical protein
MAEEAASSLEAGCTLGAEEWAPPGRMTQAKHRDR